MNCYRTIATLFVLVFCISLRAMQDSEIPPLGTAQEHIQQLFADGMRPAQIASQFPQYTHEQITTALGGSGIARFDRPSTSPVPLLALPPRPTLAEITKEELFSPCPLSRLEQVAVFVQRGLGDEEILLRLSDVTQNQVTQVRSEINLKRSLAHNQQAIDHLDALPTRNARTRPGSPKPTHVFLNKKTLYIALGATAVWATYAGYRVAKNTPEHEWQALSFADKCKKVISEIPGQMAGQVGHWAKRLAGR